MEQVLTDRIRPLMKTKRRRVYLEGDMEGCFKDVILDPAFKRHLLKKFAVAAT